MTNPENPVKTTEPNSGRAEMSIDQRIAAIEAALPMPNIAGTSIKRVLQEKQGIQWCLSLGGIGLPKTFFFGPTIEDVVSQGEHAVANMSGSRLSTDWDMLEETLISLQEE